MITRTHICLLLALFVPSSRASATDLKVTDSRGTEVLVTNAGIDTVGFLGSERESEGIKVLQGEGIVMVKWRDIRSLTVTKRDESTKPPRIEVEIVLKNGTRVAAALLRQGKMLLVGKTELGDYSIDLDKLRAIVPMGSN